MNPEPKKTGSLLFRLVAELHGERSGEVLDILRLMWTVEHDLNTLSARMVEAYGISAPHRTGLQYIALFPGISGGKLAELLQLHPSTLSGLFKQLTAKGLIERREDEDDARKMRLHATQAGWDLLRTTTTSVDAVIERVVTQAEPEKLRVTREILQRIATELESELEKRNEVKR